MIDSFLKIRLKQIFRGVLGVGIFRLPILLLLFASLFTGIFYFSKDEKTAYYLVLTILFFILFVQIKRSDKIFLKTNFRRYRFFYLVDYCLIALIPFCSLLWHSQIIPVFLLLFGCFLICFWDFNFTNKTRNTKLQQWIPDDCFEWKAGVRKMFMPIIILFVLGLLGSFLIPVVPIIIAFLAVYVLEFYNRNEPYQFVLAYELNAIHFLLYKIKMQIFLFSMLILPLAVLFLIFHHQYWYIITVEYIILISLLVYNVLLKYAFYIPNGQVPVSFIMIGLFFGLIMPIFVPVIWGLSIYFYIKANRQLNFYLSDYNR